MRLGLQVPSFTWPGGPEHIGETFALIAERAEIAGFSSLWVMDHLFQISAVGPPEHEMLEGWTALAFAVGRTSRIKLGTLVTGVTYRHPGVLVKIATTLDVLSRGRSYFGIGAAWNEDEHRGLGIPFPPLGERMDRLEETLRIALQMWAGDDRPFEGRHYRLERPLCSPLPLQKPHPPIMVGGAGERRTLRMVAQYGDACNLFAYGDLAVLDHKLRVLRGHCDAVGRPYAEIEKTTLGLGLGTIHLTRDGRDGTTTAADMIHHCEALAERGIDHAIINMRNVHEPEPFEVLARDVIPAVEALPVAGR
jgi:F420-dependent oxidoreductase-like protein